MDKIIEDLNFEKIYNESDKLEQASKTKCEQFVIFSLYRQFVIFSGCIKVLLSIY